MLVLENFRPILHRYANEDVSLGSWLIGLEVEHVDDRSMCCGTPPGEYTNRVQTKAINNYITIFSALLISTANN